MICTKTEFDYNCGKCEALAACKASPIMNPKIHGGSFEDLSPELQELVSKRGSCIECANPEDCTLGCPTHVFKGTSNTSELRSKEPKQ